MKNRASVQLVLLISIRKFIIHRYTISNLFFINSDAVDTLNYIFFQKQHIHILYRIINHFNMSQ